MKVFFISGIGADQRLFKFIHLPPGFEPVFIEWTSQYPKETLSEYAQRLFLPFSDEKQFILIGLSMGGMIAAEIAKLYHPTCTIIISSVPAVNQLPPYYKTARKLNFQRYLPATLFKITATLKHFFLLKSRANKTLMRKVIWDGNSSFIKWGMDAVLKWDNQIIPKPLFHIHGTRDEVFPLRYARPTHIIRKAGHMLVISHPKEVNAILRQILAPFL